MTATEAVETVARVTVAAQGCRCEVDITVTHLEGDHWHIEAAHDDWCPLLLATRAKAN